MTVRGEERRFGPWRAEARRLLELTGVVGLVVAQPLFDLLGTNARLLIAWRAGTVTTLLVVAIVVAGPVLATWLLEVAVGALCGRSRAHAVALGLWTGLLAVVVVRRAGVDAPVVLAGVGLLAAGATVALVRFAAVRTWLRFLAVAPLVFALLFVLASPATPIIFSHEPAVASVRVEHPHRVVMVVLDELALESILDGRGGIDPAMFPNLAALGGRATWYRNSTTVAAYTEAAVPALLTGRLPEDPDAVPAATDHPDNLFTLLGGSYRLNVHESVTRLCPASTCPPQRRLAGIHPGLSGMLRDVARIWWDFVAPDAGGQPLAADIGGLDFRAMDAGTAFVRSLRPARGPTVDFLHVLLPHFPWHYLPSGQDASAFPPLPAGLDADGAWVSGSAAALGRQRHLLQAMATDRLVGRITDRLRAIGAFDDAMIVVTADHGVAFEPGHAFRGVARSTYPSIMWTPLIVKYPGQSAGVVDDRPVESVDVLPTVGEVLGVRLPWRVDGRSLRGTPRADGARPLFEWSSNEVSPVTGRYLHFDGPAGFRTVLGRGAAAGAADDPWRVYRRGRYGDLVGTDAYRWARPEAPVAHATLVDPLRYQVVDAAATDAPWATVQGTVGLPAGRHLVLAANGTVVGVYPTVRDDDAGPGRSAYYGMVAAPLLHDGNNLVQLFAATGSPEAPVLHPVTIDPTRPP